LNPKGVLKVLLFVFVISSVGYLAYKEFWVSGPKEADNALPGSITADVTPANASEGMSTQQPTHQVIAYYFHTTYRCPTCLKIEEYTKKAVMDGFPGEIKDSLLIWKTINVEEKKNEHFIKDYQLFSKAVVVVDMEGGKQVRWKNLKDIWQLVGNQEAFTGYIQGEVHSYLYKN